MHTPDFMLRYACIDNAKGRRLGWVDRTGLGEGDTPCFRKGWLVGRLMSPFSTKIGYIGDKVLGGDLVPPN